MSRRKHPQAEPITGVTIRRGEVIRVWYGRDVVINVTHCTRCRYNVFSRRYSAEKPASEEDIRKALRQAKRWLKPPPGSIPIK